MQTLNTIQSLFHSSNLAPFWALPQRKWKRCSIELGLGNFIVIGRKAKADNMHSRMQYQIDTNNEWSDVNLSGIYPELTNFWSL